jgi:nitrogen-specific signal transduction histidine kinase
MKSEVFAFESAGWPVLLVDEASRICRANQAAVRLFGTALEGNSPALSSIWAPGNASPAEQFPAAWERSPASTVTLVLRSKGGNQTSHHVAVCSFNREGEKCFVLQLLPGTASANGDKAGDATTRQKLDCALQLARTVALDFNNALTSILGHTSLVLSRMEPGSPWKPSLLEVEKSAARAAGIANDLGTFSHQEKDARGQAAGNINAVLQRAADSVRNASGAQPHSWQLQFERKLFTAKFEEAKLQQAFTKILENATEALSSPGLVIVQTRNVELTAPAQDRNVQLAAGSYVCVEISDNGCGIEPGVLSRIFEPFFSTKRGNHRGLGLAWVYGIVTNHGGSVSVSSQPGSGTSVRVYLPADNQIVKDNAGSTDNLTGSETILFVDDEDLLLATGQSILASYGYKVLTANSGQKALEIIANPAEQVDLMITDLVMPAMSGRELMEQARQVAPDLRMLCTSGYVWPAGQERESGYLQKPFTSQDLLLKVKQTLHPELMG